MKSFATKVVKFSDNITPFGGISYVNSVFSNCGMAQLIDTELGSRGNGVVYSHSDLFRNWFNLFFCGGECAEDVQVHLRNTLTQIPDNKVSGPDTMLRAIKSLATENTQIVSTAGKAYNFNINEKMNRLNIKSLLLTGQLKKDGSYDFDYDNQIISHEKYDAKKTYKMNTGYFPGVASIGDKIVYIENRDGNANVKTGQAETLERAYLLLNEHGMTINRSRMDAGSYSEDIVKVVAKHSRLFYIRANKCGSLCDRIRELPEEKWQNIEINYKEYKVASLPFTQFLKDCNYRLVIMGEKCNGQADLFFGDSSIYRCILTNDWDSTEQEIIAYYNQRGSSEKIFDIQNNDFGWGHLPCSGMNHNTVYLILTAMIKNFYNYVVHKVSEVFTDIPATSRLKRFIFRFICVPGRWYYRSRQWTLGLYTDRPYEKLYA